MLQNKHHWYPSWQEKNQCSLLSTSSSTCIVHSLNGASMWHHLLFSRAFSVLLWLSLSPSIMVRILQIPSCAMWCSQSRTQLKLSRAYSRQDHMRSEANVVHTRGVETNRSIGKVNSKNCPQRGGFVAHEICFSRIHELSRFCLIIMFLVTGSTDS